MENPRYNLLRAFSAVALIASLAGCATGDGASRATNTALRDALLLHDSFDGRVDADIAVSVSIL